MNKITLIILLALSALILSFSSLDDKNNIEKVFNYNVGDNIDTKRFNIVKEIYRGDVYHLKNINNKEIKSIRFVKEENKEYAKLILIKYNKLSKKEFDKLDSKIKSELILKYPNSTLIEKKHTDLNTNLKNFADGYSRFELDNGYIELTRYIDDNIEMNITYVFYNK